jgi:DNA-binding NtrC family response regulator
VSDTLEVLVVSSDPEQSQLLADMLENSGFESVISGSLAEVRNLLAAKPIRMVFCEDRLNDGSYRDVLQAIAESKLPVPLIAFSPLASWELYVEAIRSGAFDCIGPIFKATEIERIVHHALSGNSRPPVSQ